MALETLALLVGSRTKQGLLQAGWRLVRLREHWVLVTGWGWGALIGPVGFGASFARANIGIGANWWAWGVIN